MKEKSNIGIDEAWVDTISDNVIVFEIHYIIEFIAISRRRFIFLLGLSLVSLTVLEVYLYDIVV